MGKGLRQPIGDPNPTIKVANTHRRCRKPRGWGRVPTLPPWSLASSVGACDLGGGVRIADRRPDPSPILIEF
ncbi:hypothetical protein CRG98_020795 [Punica granatum]|uniref:Uncharacterized protein n=1 Tax=Punica granatum TaxID=22663 RepID=A0A2I0JR86_PUNGR|nr:hypothetical protein CRG98_020795 [Punica granatum]